MFIKKLGYSTTAIILAGSLYIAGCVKEDNHVQQREDFNVALTDDIKLDMVYVSPGTFMMGSLETEKFRNINEVRHEVTLKKPFYIGKTEVTNAQYAVFLNDNSIGEDGILASGNFPTQILVTPGTGEDNCCLNYTDGKWAPAPGCGNNPAIYVSWFGAVEFCNWLSTVTGNKYQLPSEAQWEYTAKGGHKNNGYHLYSGSNNASLIACFLENWGVNNTKTNKVGLYAPNELEVFDMSGNVWEWCNDWFDDNAPAGNSADPAGPSTGISKVIKGGSWNTTESRCRNACRTGSLPAGQYNNIGFRVLQLAP